MTSGRRKTFLILEIVGVGLFFGLPLILSVLRVSLAPYILDLLYMVGLYALLALSLNVILGLAGMFNMGHAAFFAVGAYVTANLNLTYGWPILATMPLAALGAGLMALLVAIPVIHLRGDYLLIVTIGIVEIVKIALTNDIFGLTGGPNGLIGIGRPVIFGHRIAKPQDFFYLIWIMVAITALLFHWLENSRFGRALKFIKADTVAAEGMGVNAAAYKLMAFVIGAAWAGLAGAVFASKMRTISPESFTFGESVIMFTIVILGGSGHQRGVILGAFLVIGLPELFRGFQDTRLLVYGAALVAMMIFRPQGLWPPKPSQYRLPEPFDQKYPKGGNGSC
ncbi:MAG: branched-chain amino acid ABC transporter permease [Deltaproteobacteria bacterium]|jgi:branched-chain amino acid transport system permease protein|nr:branched-chain amino acid ABC transporter permease [Deltaproteobacteria bacterium]